LIKNYPTQNTKNIAVSLDMPISAIQARVKYLKLHKELKWTPERVRLLQELYPENRNIDIAPIIGVTEDNVAVKAFQLKLRKSRNFFAKYGLNTRFKKGIVPVNTGQKMSTEVYEKVKHTFFSKGNMPVNHRQVGSERVTVDGYVEVKIKEPRTWAQKHRLVWEQNHGEIPKGFLVQFKDANRQNCDISNLYLITRNKQILQNTISRYPKELQQSIRLVHKLNRKIKEHEQQN
jgi:hypothetical protein